MTPHCLQTGDSLNGRGREEETSEGMPQFLGNMEVQVFIQESASYPQHSQNSQQGQSPRAQPETSDPAGQTGRGEVQ